MNLHIIESSEQFQKYFHLLKKSASIGSTPNVFVIGFDIEFFDRAHYPNSFEKSLEWVINNSKSEIIACTIQIATKDICLVMNLVKMKYPLPKNLIKLLTNEAWIKVGVGIELDLKILSNNYELGHCSGGIEMRNIALLAHHTTPNLENLFSQFVTPYKKRTHSIHDWSIELTREQILYAGFDAIMSYRLFNSMIEPSLNFIREIIIKGATDSISSDTNMHLSDSSSDEGSSLNDSSFNNDSIDDILSNNELFDAFNALIDNKSSNDILVNDPLNEIYKDNASINDEIPSSKKLHQHVNYIGKLNEMAQKRNILYPSYNFLTTIDGTFTSTCIFNNLSAKGQSRTKQEAKRLSAMNMYHQLIK